MEIKVVRQILEWNEDCHKEVQKTLNDNNVKMINIMGSPGAGKTTFILNLINELKKKDVRVAVIEGDIEGTIDAKRIQDEGIPVVQLNTQGACHIEAMSIKNIINKFDLNELDLIIVENIGNLVCPAEFEIGEVLKVALLSIPEGDDKVEKYPLLFAESNILVLNKYDMMEHFDFNENKVEKDTRSINSDCSIFKVSSRTGREIDSLVKHIEDKMKEK